MGKLNPPHLGNKLPAFYIDNNKTLLQIPFEFNRSVGKEEFNKMQILIKTVQTNSEKFSGPSTEIDKDKGVASFSLGDFVPSPGQYYKIQLAFINSLNEIGFYSNVGIAKCTTKPNVLIEKLQQGQTNNVQYTYTGSYSNNDTNEKVYNYYFNIYDINKKLYETSGLLIHDHSKDIGISSSVDSWSPIKTLSPGQTYTIVYGVETLNGLKIETAEYQVANNFLASPPDWFDGELHATLNHDDGYIELTMHGQQLSGNFIISRSSNKDNFETWHKITELTMWSMFDGITLWKDYTIEQGVEYLYSIQLFNSKGLSTIHMLNKEKKIVADFEDMFLFDGKRQLKIRFNPKVTTFKNNRLESKVDTIGGQFPHFFRNGSVSYKEFPISGLLSLQADDNQLFAEGVNQQIKWINPNAPVLPGRTQLTTNNIHDEREFKLEVLSWLQNGEPKLFRSPGEGNYIVRIMNISATPNDTLGRMIHTFTSTAYEIMDYNFENLKASGYLNVDDVVDWSTYKVENVPLQRINEFNLGVKVHNNKVKSVGALPMRNLVIKDALPNTPVIVTGQANQLTNLYGNYNFIINPTEFSFGDNSSLEFAHISYDFIGDFYNKTQWKRFDALTQSTNGTVPESKNNLYNTHYGQEVVNYMSDLKNLQAGEVLYVRIYERPIPEVGPDETPPVYNYTLNIDSYDKCLNGVKTKDGFIYKNCGTLSVLQCGNGYNVDIVYTTRQDR